jgi:hypothetical protein
MEYCEDMRLVAALDSTIHSVVVVGAEEEEEEEKDRS